MKLGTNVRSEIISESLAELRAKCHRALPYADGLAVGKEIAIRMLDGITKMSDDDIIQLRSGLKRSEAGYLRGLAHSFAELAVRYRSVSWLERGVIALLIEDGEQDERESLRTLSFLCNSAVMLGVSLFDVIRTSHRYGTPELVSLFAASSHGGCASVEEMGYRAVDSQHGFAYEPIR